MDTPFRKLIRITVILISLIVLFNFFGYYLIRAKSEENEKTSALVSIASHQQMLSQTIIKEAVLLLNLSENDPTVENVRTSLTNHLIEFDNNNKFLRGEVKVPGAQQSKNSFEITHILTNCQTHVNTILAIGNEVASSDAVLLSINKKLYMKELFYS